MKIDNPFGSSEISALTLTPESGNMITSHSPAVVSRREVTPVVPPAGEEIDSDLGGICETYLLKIDGVKFVKKTDSHGIHALMNEWFAYEVCAALGFKFVPPTYFCRDANYNLFTLQRFVENASTWTCSRHDVQAKVNRDKLTNIMLFDYLISNSDRHGSNFMLTQQAEPYAIDHHLIHSYFDFPDLVCYRHNINDRATLNEFARRLSAANLDNLLATCKTEDAEAFRARASRIILNAWRTFEEAYDSLRRWRAR